MKRSRKPRSTRPIEIVNFVYSLGYANTFHITKVLFPPEPQTGNLYQTESAQAKKHLLALRRRKLLSYTEQLIRPTESRKPYIYYCARSAYETILQGKERLPAPNVWDSKLNHHIIVRDVFTDIMVSTQITGDRIEAFKTTETLRSEHGLYIPDWFFSMRIDDGEPYLYFLELDLGTEPETKWKAKLTGIKSFWDSSHYQTTYRHYRIRWLIVAKDEQRAALLKRWTEEEGGKSRFWFTSLNRINPLTVLKEPIWMVSAQEGYHEATKVKR